MIPDIENNIRQTMFSKNSEKTFIDKILGKDDIDKLRQIIKKNKLDRSDYSDLTYLLCSSESKLVNYTANDRYIILKYFVWIRETIKTNEEMFDYEEELKSNGIELDEEEEELLQKARARLEHSIKFMIDLYLNIARTTLSIDGKGFQEILLNRFEINYGQSDQMAANAKNNSGWFGGGNK